MMIIDPTAAFEALADPGVLHVVTGRARQQAFVMNDATPRAFWQRRPWRE
ncbi:hypothetical protein ACQW02_07200 [Humitalea sp. 24SJ18S-53]